jgi:hypothetical protein
MWQTAFPILCLFANPNAHQPAVDLRIESAPTEIAASSPFIRVDTLPNASGIVRRMEIAVREGATYFAVISASYDGECPTEKVLVAPRYKYDFLGLLWPTEKRRIVSIVASEGESPQRDDTPTAETYSLSFGSRSKITYVMQLSTDRLPQLFLRDQDEHYRREFDHIVAYYRGVSVIGVLALVLLGIFVISFCRHQYRDNQNAGIV